MSIDDHLDVVFVALAINHWIEHHIGRNFDVRADRPHRYRTIVITTGDQTLT